MTPEQIADVLDDAADVIEQRGWTTGLAGWGDGQLLVDFDREVEEFRAGGPLCIEGGICAAAGLVPSEVGLDVAEHHPAMRAVFHHLGWVGDLWQWNDQQDNAQPVLDALRAAAKQQRSLA